MPIGAGAARVRRGATPEGQARGARRYGEGPAPSREGQVRCHRVTYDPGRDMLASDRWDSMYRRTCAATVVPASGEQADRLER